jgi:hypothetical protein
VTSTHTVGISFTNSAISTFPITESTTVTSTDTSTTVAERLASIITGNGKLAAAGISAISNGPTIVVVQQGTYSTTTTLASTGTDTVYLGPTSGKLTSGVPGAKADYYYSPSDYTSLQSPGRAGTYSQSSIDAKVGGTATGGDHVAITITGVSAVNGGAAYTEAFYTVVSGDTVQDIAAGVAAKINADSTLSAAGVSASSFDGIITVNLPITPAATSNLSASITGSATESLTFTAHSVSGSDGAVLLFW